MFFIRTIIATLTLFVRAIMTSFYPKIEGRYLAIVTEEGGQIEKRRI